MDLLERSRQGSNVKLSKNQLSRNFLWKSSNNNSMVSQQMSPLRMSTIDFNGTQIDQRKTLIQRLDAQDVHRKPLNVPSSIDIDIPSPVHRKRHKRNAELNKSANIRLPKVNLSKPPL